MKGVVAYDSVHGNTKQVAEAIAEQIRSEGHQDAGAGQEARFDGSSRGSTCRRYWFQGTAGFGCARHREGFHSQIHGSINQLHQENIMGDMTD